MATNNAAQPSSGTTGFNPAFSDVILESFSRIQVRPTSLTSNHLRDAQMSANLLMGEWQIKPSFPNLWKVQLTAIPLEQGQTTYSLPATTVGVLDAYIRQFEMNAAVSVAPAFTTVSGNQTVAVNFPNHGQSAGNWVAVLVQVSVGGIVIQGQFQVVTVLDPNNLTISVPVAPTAPVSGGGAVPVFTSTVNSESVEVTLNNHGLVAGNEFNVPVSTAVGGLTISGMYQVATYVDANHFTITANVNASSSATEAENGGLASLQGQNTTVAPFDRVIYPISRSEYASYPNKQSQGFPSVFWFDRLLQPNLTLWLVPDGNGPYTLYVYVMQQSFDVVTSGGATLDMPWRFLEAFCAALAGKLAWKYPPPPQSGVTVAMVEQRAQQAWDWASAQDVEEVPLYLVPGLTSFYR